jgi:hypothetical protein
MNSVSYAPERLEGESFEQYKMRRAMGNAQIKVNAKGRMFWNSQEQGTYIKAKAQ